MCVRVGNRACARACVFACGHTCQLQYHHLTSSQGKPIIDQRPLLLHDLMANGPNNTYIRTYVFDACVRVRMQASTCARTRACVHAHDQNIAKHDAVSPLICAYVPLLRVMRLYGQEPDVVRKVLNTHAALQVSQSLIFRKQCRRILDLPVAKAHGNPS